MLWLPLTAAFLCFVGILAAQDLPAGTAIPIMLSSSLDARKDKPGEKIDGKSMQEVLLPSGAKIKSGSHVVGHVVSVVKPKGGGSSVVVKFDQLKSEGQVMPLSVSLRALAATESVFNAKLPTGNQSDYESSDEWTTRQVGGEVVNRGRGVLASTAGIVGRYSGSGVWGRLTASSDGDCPAANGDEREQALWVFSTSACGVYGFSDMKLAHNGSSAPVGQIELHSNKDVLVRGGSGWLLLVNASGPAQ